MDFIAQYWPFGTSGLGLAVGAIVVLFVLKFVAGLIVRLVSIAIVALGVGFWAFPQYMPFQLPFLSASAEPKWVLVSSGGDASGQDVAYSVSVTPKLAVDGLPVCNKDNLGKVAVCGSPDASVIAGMAMSGLPTDLSVSGIPTGVCTYKSVETSGYLNEGGENKVYQCRH
jgi:hypothetical protein